MISGIFRDYYCGIFGYYSKHYIFKNYFLRANCPFKMNKEKTELVIFRPKHMVGITEEVQLRVVEKTVREA